MQELARHYISLAKEWGDTEAVAAEERMKALKNLLFWRYEKLSVDSETIGKGTTFSETDMADKMPNVTALDFAGQV